MQLKLHEQVAWLQEMCMHLITDLSNYMYGGDVDAGMGANVSDGG